MMEFLELIEQMLSFAPPEYASTVAAFNAVFPWLVLAVTLLTCFFGHKIHKLWVAFLFFSIGFFTGALLGVFFPPEMSNSPFIMLGLILGVLAAYYSGRLRFLQLFLLNAFFVFSALPALLARFLSPAPAMLLSIAAAIAAGILAAKYQHIVTTITTAISSGLNAGPMLLSILKMPNSTLSLVLGGVLAASGLAFQLIPEWREWREKRREARRSTTTKET